MSSCLPRRRRQVCRSWYALSRSFLAKGAKSEALSQMEKRPLSQWIGRIFTLLVLFFLGGVAVQQYIGAETFRGWVEKAQSATGMAHWSFDGFRTAALRSDYSDDASFSTRVVSYVERVTGSAYQTIKTNTGVDVATWMPWIANSTPSGADSSFTIASRSDQASRSQAPGTRADDFHARVSEYSEEITEKVSKTYNNTVGKLTRSFGFGMNEAAAPEAEKSKTNPFKDTNVMDFSEGDDGTPDEVDISGVDADRQLKTDDTDKPAAKMAEPKDSKIARLDQDWTQNVRPPQPKAQPVGKPPRFDIVSFDADGEGVAAGEAEPNWRVSVMSGGKEIADAEVDAQGRWVILFDKNLKPGDHKLSLTATPPGGSEKVRSEQSVDIRFGRTGTGNFSKELPYVAILEPNNVTRVLQKPKRVAKRQPPEAEPVRPVQKQVKAAPPVPPRETLKPKAAVKQAATAPARDKSAPGWWAKGKEKAGMLAEKTKAAAKRAKTRVSVFAGTLGHPV